MSSSQSDIDEEPSKVIKPKKFKTKFLKLLNSESESEDTQQVSIHSKIDSTFYQKEPNRFQKQKHLNEGYNKFDRRMPLAITILQSLVKKNVRFGTDEQDNQMLTSSQKKKQKKIKNKVCFSNRTSFEQQLQNQKQQQTQKNTLTQITNISHMTSFKTRSNTLKKKPSKGSNTKLKQATSPLFSKTRKTHQIKQIKRNGNKIRATWYLGKINGYAEVDYYDGGKFKGIFQNGQMVSGQLNFGQGCVYTGQFSDFKFHGKGKFMFPQGHFFQGTWQHGNLMGKATIIYPKGQVYYGQVLDFKRHGQGYLYMNNRQKYCGDFYYGDLTGFGQYYVEGKIIKKGYWIKGKYLGQKQQQFKKNINEIKLLQKQQKKTSNYIQNLQKRRVSMFIPTESLAFINDKTNEDYQGYQETSEGKSDSFIRISSFS